MRNFEKKILDNFDSLRRTELKQIMERLFRERELLQGSIEAMPAAFFSLSNKAEVLFVNHTGKLFCKRPYLFIPQTKLVGKKIFSLIYNETLLKILQKFFLDSERPIQKNITVFDKIDHSREFSVWIFPNKTPAAQNNFILFDVTAWKEKKLEEEQESSIISLNLLTSGIAHEIKNPLGALDLHLQLIKRFLKNHAFSGKEKINELLKIINDEIRRLDNIVNDFLASFRPRKPMKKLINLNKIILETLAFFSPKLEDKGIKLFIDLDETLKLYPFDPDHMKQVILNLLKNSMEAIAEVERPGKIAISTTQIDQKVVLTLKDNGTGIPKNYLSKLFRPYQTTKKMGTGLGLSIISKLVKEHDGEIIVNSSAKKGTEFIIEFDPNLSLVRLLENQSHTNPKKNL